LVLSNGLAPFVPASTPEHLHYRENIIGASVSQLLGDMVVGGVRFAYDQVELDDNLPEVSTSVLPSARQSNHSDLYTLSGYVLLNHPSGFFARADATWYHQYSSGYAVPEPGDDFVQENIFVGYRFLNRRIELLLGILNLSDQNYNLNPLTVYTELPRERAF